MDIARAIFNTSGMQQECSALEAEHTTYSKWKSSSVALVEHSRIGVAMPISPILCSHFWIKNPSLAATTRARRIIGLSHTYGQVWGGSWLGLHMFFAWWEIQAIGLQELTAGIWVSSDCGFKFIEHEDDLNDEPLIHHYVDKPEPFIEEFPKEGSAKLKAHARWYDEKPHETVLKVYIINKSHRSMDVNTNVPSHVTLCE